MTGEQQKRGVRTQSWCPPAYVSSRHLQMCAKLKVCLYSQSSKTSKQASLTERFKVCFSLLSVLCPGGGHLPNSLFNCCHPVGPRNASPSGHRVLLDSQTEATLVTRARRCKVCPGSSHKFQGIRQVISSFLEDTSKLKHDRRRAQRTHSVCPMGHVSHGLCSL